MMGLDIYERHTHTGEFPISWPTKTYERQEYAYVVRIGNRLYFTMDKEEGFIADPDLVEFSVVLTPKILLRAVARVRAGETETQDDHEFEPEGADTLLFTAACGARYLVALDDLDLILQEFGD